MDIVKKSIYSFWIGNLNFFIDENILSHNLRLKYAFYLCHGFAFFALMYLLPQDTEIRWMAIRSKQMIMNYKYVWRGLDLTYPYENTIAEHSKWVAVVRYNLLWFTVFCCRIYGIQFRLNRFWLKFVMCRTSNAEKQFSMACLSWELAMDSPKVTC